METLFKRHFWIFHAGFLAVVAFILASGVNAIAGHALSEALMADQGKGQTARAPSRGVDRDFDLASESNIFDGKRELPVEPGQSTACVNDADCTDNQKCLPVEGDPSAKECQVELKPGEIDFANAVQSELPLRLVGTSVFFSYPEDSLASIVDQGGGKGAEALVYSINPCESRPERSEEDDPEDESNLLPEPAPCQLLPGGHTLLAIELDRIYLQNNERGRTEYVLLEEAPEAPKVARATPTPRATAKSDGDDEEMGKGITKVGPNKYEVTRDELTNALGNMSKLATQARIVPAFEGGEAIGFKLFSIRPGSLYSKIGIQNGDIIQKVNGYEITSPDKALEIYQKLKDGAAFTVDVKRRGQPVTLDYSVTQ